MALTTQERDNIVKLAVGMFNAAPGSTYLQEFTAFFEANGRSLSSLANYFAGSSAYKGIYPNFQSAAEFASTFLTPLGLQANTVATDFVTSRFNKGQSTQSIMLDTLIALDATTDSAFTTAKAILNNKTSVATTYSLTNSALTLSALQAVVSSVDATAASVTAANAANSSASGNTFTLTTGVDSQTATIFNGVIDFNGGTVAGANSTLNSGDRITGTSATTDVLNVTLTNAGAAIGGTAVQQVTTVTTSATLTAVTDAINFTYNGTAGVVAGTAARATDATALAAAINAIAGSTVAVAGATTVTITAPTAGTGFVFGITNAVDGTTGFVKPAVIPTAATTTANVVGSNIALGVNSGVEVLNLTNTSGQASTMNIGNTMAGANTLNVTGSTNSSTFTNIQTAVNKLGISSIVTDGVDETYTYAAGLTGATDTLTLTLSGVQSATVPAVAGNFPVVLIRGAAAGSGWDIVNVVASGANRLESLTVNDQTNPTVSKINVSGTGTLNTGSVVMDFLNTSGVVDASANSGGVTMAFGADDVTFTGGSGADKITFSATNFSVTDVVNGGGGTNTLGIADTTIDNTTVALNAALLAAQNFTKLELRGASATVDTGNANLNAFTNFTYAGTAAGAFSLTNLQATDTVSVSLNGAAGNTTLAGAVGVTSASLSLASTGTTAGGTGSLTITGLNTLALSIGGSANTGAISTGAITLDASTVVTVTGANTAGLTVASLSSASTLDASAFTGPLTVQAGSAGNDLIRGSATGINTITASAGNDTITGGTAADAFTGGAGRDTITGGGGGDTYTITVATDSIGTGFVAGNALNAAYLATLTNNTWDIVTAAAGDRFITNLAGGPYVMANAATTAVIAGAAVAARTATYWNDGTNTYLIADSNADAAYTAADLFIVVTGVRTFAASGTTDIAVIS